MNSLVSESQSRLQTKGNKTGGITKWIERAQERIAEATGEPLKKGLLLTIDSLTRIADTRKLTTSESLRLATAQKKLRKLSGVE
ncbi:MAG: hypothetical protein QY312_01075 [Candidatus Dojkabacteria bacterium]|nr:MAG: hypothetical protein QY312_01075 [Candidatus Dojkabacteria bacterium]